MERSYDKNCRSAIVTGAGSGLGLATSIRLVSEGYHVTAVDLNANGTLKNLKRSDAVSPALLATHVVIESCNVSDEQRAEEVVDVHTKRWGAPEVLVNCAGIAAPGATLRKNGPMELAEFRNVIEVNLIGSFNFIRLCARAMQTQGKQGADGQRGVIVNTSSAAAFDGMVGQAAYSSSKGGIAAMTLPLARELGSYGIRVMAIAPGVFSTPMIDEMPEKSRDIVSAMRPPFPNRLGNPSEFAALVMTIIDNHMLNGEVIRLDGGIRLKPR